MDKQYIDHLILKTIDKDNLAGVVLNVSSGNNSLNMVASADNLQDDSKY